MGRIVLLLDDIDAAGKTYLKKHDCEVILSKASTEEERIKEIQDYHPAGMITKTGMKVTKEMVAASPALEVIARHGVGYDNIDMAAAEACHVRVTHVPDGNYISVAEHAMFLLLACAKQYGVVSKEFKKGNFQIRKRAIGEEVKGRTLGLIGTGHIGKELAIIAVRGFGMKAIGYSRHSEPGSVTDEGIRMADSRETVLKEADFVVLCLPSTPQTRHSITLKELSLMKKETYLINVARGDILVESDLIQALREGRIAGAGLDVFEQEPTLADNPLLAMDNVIATPHYAAITSEALKCMGMSCAVQVVQVLDGKEPDYPVN